MKTIILTILILVTSVQVSNAQNIEKLFGSDLTKNRHLNFERTSDSSEVFVSYDPSKRSRRKCFFLVCEEKGISCIVRDDGSIAKAYIDFPIEEKNEDMPEIVFSAEVAKDDPFINYYIRGIVEEFLQNISTYTWVEYNY